MVNDCAAVGVREQFTGTDRPGILLRKVGRSRRKKMKHSHILVDRMGEEDEEGMAWCLILEIDHVQGF